MISSITEKVNPERCCIALLILQPILFFWRTVISFATHIPYDIEGYHLPQIRYIAQCFARGVLPLWDPYTYAGMPIHADLQAQLFYPPTWVVMLFGNLTDGRYLYYWLEWMIPLHMMLAGVVMFILLRRMQLQMPTALLGASVFQLGSFFASQAQHLCAVCVAGWLPPVALCVFELRHEFRIRWVAGLAVAVAMSILGGFAAATIVVAGVAILFALALILLRESTWKIASPIAAGYVWGAVIAAATLIPLATLTSLSLASLRSFWFTTGGGITLHALVSLVIPNYFHIFDLENYKLPDNFTFLYIYSGIIPLILVAITPFSRNRKTLLFLCATVIATFWMLGENTPVFLSIFPLFPRLLRGAMYAEYAMIAFAFFMGITAALELNRLAAKLPRLLVWTLVLFTSADLIYAGSGRPMNSDLGGSRIGDAHSEFLEGTERARQAFTAILDKTYPPARLDYMDIAFAQGQHGAAALRIPTTDGDNPFMLIRTHRLRSLYASGGLWERWTSVDHIDSPLLNMVNVSYLESLREVSRERVAKAGLESMGNVLGVNLYRNPHALPRFFLVPAVRKSSSEDETFRLLGDASFDPAATAVVEGLSSDSGQLAVAPVQVNLWSENRIELTVTTTGPAFLVSSEAMYPGWKATINNRPQPLLMTNGAFRGMQLSAGENHIVMEYRPVSALFAIVISLLAALPAFGFIVIPNRAGLRANVGRFAMKWLPCLPLVLFIAFAGYQVFGPVPIGLANNDDFARILGSLRLWTPANLAGDRTQFMRFFVNDYLIHDPRWRSGVPSSEWLIAAAAKNIGKLFLPHDTFKLQFMGLLHLAMFAGALFIFLRALRKRALWLRLFAGLLLFVIWADFEYVQHFNTAYTDAGAIGALAIVFAIGVHCLIAENDWRWAPGVAVAGSFLIATKTQHQTSLLAFIPFCIYFAFRTSEKRTRMAWLAVPVFLIATAGWMLKASPSDYRTPPAFTVVFFKIAPLSGDPKAVLADFHMPENEFLKYVGHYYYESIVPQDDVKFRDRILKLVTPGSLASFYIRHPSILASVLLTDLHEKATDVDLNGYGHLREVDFKAHKKPFELTLWSGLRIRLSQLTPNYLIWLFAFALIFCVACIVKPAMRQRWVAWPLVLFGLLLAIPAFLFASLLDAAETPRHLVFFQMSTDLMLFSSVFAIALVYEQRVSVMKVPVKLVAAIAAGLVLLWLAAGYFVSKDVDDADERISYTGAWDHGKWPLAKNGTTSVTTAAGATARLEFSGTEFTWVYAKAYNRGIASVKIDGVAHGELDQYDPKVIWQSQTTFRGLSRGKHTLEITVLGKKNAASQDAVIDLDALLTK